MKYTDEQLSRILSAADNGRLVRFGSSEFSPGYGCIEQTARVIPFLYAPTDPETNPDAADWFDREGHVLASRPDAMLRALEKRGWA